MARGSVTGRVTKRASSATSSASSSSAVGGSRMSARQKSRLVEEASGSSRGGGGGGAGRLQDMVDEAAPPEYAMGMKGVRQDWVEADNNDGDGDSGGGEAGEAELCPITDKDEKPFELMKLPAEIRNEIYRACLTRPFNILLSRKEAPPPPPPPEPEVKEAEDVVANSSLCGGREMEDLNGTQTWGDLASIPDYAYGQFRSQLGVGSNGASANGAMTSTSQAAAASAFRAWQIGYSGSLPSSASSSSSSANSTTNANQASIPSNAPTASSNPGVVFRRSALPRPSRPASRSTTKPDHHRDPRPQDADPLLVNILRVSKTVYQEARSILYSENLFTLDLDTALPTLAMLHQRSRRQIKHVELEIPCYNEILERFQETVRLSLRYCWGLRTLVVHMPFTLPGADGSGTTGNTTVYANGFDILRWLPKQCEVVLRGNVCAEIESVVRRNANLAKTLDELAYARRQLISNESESAPSSQQRNGPATATTPATATAATAA